MKNLPIGYIDSGYGGLSVVRQSLRQLPNESIIYFGDNARNPYGPRHLEEVKAFIWQMTDFLLDKGIKMLVIACNTGTAAALDEIRQGVDIPVIGVIHPGSRAAIKKTKNHRIGIIGTEGTIQSGLYESVLLKDTNQLQVTSLACPSFVQMVEDNLMDDDAIQAPIDQKLQIFKDRQVDTLILGCTHYPLLSERIQASVGQGVKLVDSGVETVNEITFLLDYFQLSKNAQDAQEHAPTQVYYTTGDVAPFKEVAQKWLASKNLDVRHVDLEEVNDR